MYIGHPTSSEILKLEYVILKVRFSILDIEGHV